MENTRGICFIIFVRATVTVACIILNRFTHRITHVLFVYVDVNGLLWIYQFSKLSKWVLLSNDVFESRVKIVSSIMQDKKETNENTKLRGSFSK